jgi:hypothetical protein
MFGLLNRRAMQALRELQEEHLFMKGLFAWIRFPKSALDYSRDPRRAGRTNMELGTFLELRA